MHLHRDSVRHADLVTPVPTTDGHKVELRSDDPTTDGSSNLLGALLAEADVAVAVANRHVANEARPLSGTRLLLHRHDLHHIILQLRSGEQSVDDLELLDRKRMEVDVLDSVDTAFLHQTAELRARHPLLLLALALALLSLLAALAVLPFAETALEIALAFTFVTFATHVSE